MKVTNFPMNPGQSGWNKLLPTRMANAPLEGHKTTDILIIGAGFAGLAAAARARQIDKSTRIVVLEAGEIGDGPSGRNSGFMIDLPHDLASSNYGGAADRDRQQTQENRAAISFCADLARQFNFDAETFAISGKINGAASAKGDRHNHDYAGHLQNLGEAHSILDAKEMAELTGSTYYRSGLFTPGTAMIQPAMFIRRLADELARLGVTIYENSAVKRLNRTSEWRASTTGGTIGASKVILAVNGHAQSFGQFKNQLMHVYTYGSMSRALSAEECTKLGGAPMWGITPADPLGTSVRRLSGTGGDRILIRNRFTYDPKMGVPKNRLAKISRDHDRAFKARFSMLKDVRMEFCWGGHLCLSRNAEPAFGEVERDLFVAACQNGLGTTKGTLAGMLAAEAALGQKSQLLTQYVQKPKPTRLPPNVIATPVAKTIIRWGELRAGNEL